MAGSRGKTGAAHLAAVGALRSGAGLVTRRDAASCQPIVAAMGAEYMTEPLDETADGHGRCGRRRGGARRCEHDVIAVGPGLGRGAGRRAVRPRAGRASEAPLVLDADALERASPTMPTGCWAAAKAATIVITPHPGEMARLVGMSGRGRAGESPRRRARLRACRTSVYVVLKGYRTLVATPDGQVFINPTGNPGMATGGTGDVLTGMLAAWLAQLLDAEAACRWPSTCTAPPATWPRPTKGEVAMTAGDLARHIWATPCSS